MTSRMRESASTDLREPQGSNPLGRPGPKLGQLFRLNVGICGKPEPAAAIHQRRVCTMRISSSASGERGQTRLAAGSPAPLESPGLLEALEGVNRELLS